MVRRRKRTKIDHKNTDPIPRDLVNEILQRLPVKSIAKFRGVSKSWATIIRSIYFINSFSLRRSMGFQTQQEPHHRLLFAFNKTQVLSDESENWTFYSLSLINLATDYEKQTMEFIPNAIPPYLRYSDPPIYVKGLLSFFSGRKHVISNPSVGKSIILPVVKCWRNVQRSYFGYDPIKAEYKVLCIIKSARNGITRHNQVLTVTVGSKSLWREIDLWIPHRPHSKSVCIDGIIYYLAYDLQQLILVRFDVRSEKFLKQLPSLSLRWTPNSNLINYNSKLAIAIAHETNHHSIDLWVLEDAEKLQWSKISHNISPWKYRFYDIEILHTTPTGENVYTCKSAYNDFYVIYQDHKKGRQRIVDVTLNMNGDHRRWRSKIGFIDYVESVMLL